VVSSTQAIHRAAAGVDDLPQPGQIGQQPLQGGHAIAVGGAVAIGIHLLIAGGGQAEHRGIGIHQGCLQSGWIIRPGHHHRTRMRFQLSQPGCARGGEREINTSLLPPVAGQGQADVAAAHDRDPHRRLARLARG
jgi:hypothetical protein